MFQKHVPFDCTWNIQTDYSETGAQKDSDRAPKNLSHQGPDADDVINYRLNRESLGGASVAPVSNDLHKGIRWLRCFDSTIFYGLIITLLYFPYPWELCFIFFT